MKTYKTLGAIIGMMALLATSQTNAQIPPTSGGGGSGGGGGGVSSVPAQLPISMDDLQARAWESVANIDVYGWASSFINATTNDKSGVNFPYSPAAGVVDVDEVFTLIQEQRLQFSVLYPSDTISLGAALYDKNWNNLFYGNSSGKINPPENGVSKNTLDIVLNMNDSTLLQFDNAVGFYIVERDAAGNPVRYYYSREWDIQNGWIRFPNYFSEKGGEIVVRLADGTEVAYGLGNRGQRIVPTTVLLKAGEVSALGTRTFRNTNTVYVEVSPKEFDKNINPLSRLVVGGEKPSWHNFAAWLTDQSQSDSRIMEYASTVLVWRYGQLSSTAKPLEIKNPPYYVPIFLEPGHYWVKFSFKSGWPYGNQFYPPYQGGM
jgi:hypothetical protein